MPDIMAQVYQGNLIEILTRSELELESLCKCKL